MIAGRSICGGEEEEKTRTATPFASRWADHIRDYNPFVLGPLGPPGDVAARLISPSRGGVFWSPDCAGIAEAGMLLRMSSNERWRVSGLQFASFPSSMVDSSHVAPTNPIIQQRLGPCSSFLFRRYSRPYLANA